MEESLPNDTEIKVSTSSNQQFDDRKQHYESLISLFKYVISLLIGLITLIGFFVGFTTYQNGNEMRMEMKEQQKELQRNLNDVNAEKSKMREILFELIKTTREEVSTTRENAIDQINSIRDESTIVARNEARKQIEEVFQKNRMEDFIAQVAKERIEPQVNKIVDSKFAGINESKFAKALKDLLSDNETSNELALLYFQNADPADWSEEQLRNAVEVLKKMRESTYYKGEICIYLGLTKSPLVESYFASELKENPQGTVGKFAFYHFLKGESSKVLDLYLMGYQKYQVDLRLNFFYRAIEGSIASRNGQLALSFLNYKELVDLVFKDSEQINRQTENPIQATRQSIEHLLKDLNSFDGQYRSSYFFSK